MELLLTGLADNWPAHSALGQFFSTFEGDIGPSGHSLPLRIAGGLHALVLSGRAPELSTVYPPNRPSSDRLVETVLAALDTNTAFLLNWVQNAPQTNEVRRSAALMAGARVAVARHRLPLVVSELGASGGLNLMWDRYALQIGVHTFGAKDAKVVFAPDWSGPMPPTETPVIVSRRGVDLAPVDTRTEDGRLKLRSYLWADQPDRMALTDAAMSSLDATVDEGDAADWLITRLAAQHPGHLHLIQHSVAWQYFPQKAQDKARAAIYEAGAGATGDAPIGWLAMEADNSGRPGAALILRLWPGDITLDLGRADFHGRWIDWRVQGQS